MMFFWSEMEEIYTINGKYLFLLETELILDDLWQPKLYEQFVTSSTNLSVSKLEK